MEVLEGQNILVTISGKKNRVRVYYLSWLKSKILRTDGLSDVSVDCHQTLGDAKSLTISPVVQQQVERRNGWINVGDLQGAVHFKIVKYERIKFLVIALKDSIEIYAWAPKPYHKFMAFKVRRCVRPPTWIAHCNCCCFVFFWLSAEFRRSVAPAAAGRPDHRRPVPAEGDLRIRGGLPCGRPGLGHRLRCVSAEARTCCYGRHRQLHSIELTPFCCPRPQTQGPIIPHCIVALPNSNGMQLLLCYDNEGVYVNTHGRVSKNIVLQVCCPDEMYQALLGCKTLN